VGAILGPGERVGREAASDRAGARGERGGFGRQVGNATRQAGPAPAAEPLTQEPHTSVVSKFPEKLKNIFPHKKNRYKVRKNLKKIKEVGNPIWSNFCDYNSLRFFTEFELFQIF
jgi:hypothetical protein